ncbi:MAG: hypothetical protein EP330_09945 [Deltaproteobacteria bacterium]|nr:MAG: hypothetical protein EP330_09945 [Deltaproteobacteria bacterium]
MRFPALMMWLSLAVPALAGRANLDAEGEAAATRLHACESGEACDPERLVDDLFTLVVHRWVSFGAVDRQSAADLALLDTARFAELPKHLQLPASSPSAWLVAALTPPPAAVQAPLAETVPEQPAETVDEPEPETAEDAMAEAPTEPTDPEAIRGEWSVLSAVPAPEPPSVMIKISDVAVTHRVIPDLDEAWDYGFGECRVRVSVGTDGVPTDIEPLLCGAFHYGPVREALLRWRFEPVEQDERVVPFQTDINVKYKSTRTTPEDTEAYADLVSRYGFLEPNPKRCELAADLYPDGKRVGIGTIGTTDLMQCFAVPSRVAPAWPDIAEQVDCRVQVEVNAYLRGRVIADSGCSTEVLRAARRLVASWDWAKPTYGDSRYQLQLRFHPDEG